MIRIGSITSTPACPSCGDRCTDCGDRMCTLNGPEPAPRCSEHPCCSGVCSLAPVYCWACKELLADIEQDAMADAGWER